MHCTWQVLSNVMAVHGGRKVGVASIEYEGHHKHVRALNLQEAAKPSLVPPR